MKATHKTFAGMMDRALRQARVFYFCGADEAGASDAAARVIERLGPAEKVEMTGAELRRDPVRLADEARSTSLFGDHRIIIITMSGDEAYEAISTLIADPVPGWPVLAIAGGATDKSRIAKLLADRDDALVTVFHPPDLRAVAEMVRTLGDTAGLRLNSGLAEQIALATGLDTRMARSEIEKLVLYLDAAPESPRAPTPADLAAIGAATEDDSIAPLINAALGGQTKQVGHELARVTAQDVNGVALLLAFERRVVTLFQLAGRLGTRTDISAFLEGEIQARRVFFRDKADLAQQLGRWRGARLERLAQRLIALHRAMLTDNRLSGLRLAHEVVEVVRAAAR
ncbi:DNA polymerase III, delta subunit [Novosphingobium nitrogenifigens DSM 19370]|uniref:DNA-directed DNA polymerase n=1 Tax=Novosphingobium nitrogenifigens DSM 19370 TaxID=983920 RepID=F1ZDT8_9SPHN|nr:hypothetical protein [Novosphingobium nitrogenifigens]EGD57225.1 DNA polymerase III, delta subunit [Novosphingobium nitrogenifigens DSM 19370]